MEQRIKILILEHDAYDVELLQYELKRSELDCETTIVQAREAYEKALVSFCPDIILSDYCLPDFDGFSAFQIKQQHLPGTPFIIVSGVLGDERAVDLIKVGITDYVLKEKLYQVAPKIRRALKEAADRKQKEEGERQLKIQEQQLRKIMDLSLDVICTLDREARFVTVGAACVAAWGYLPGELTGKSALELVHPEDLARTRQAVADLSKGVDLVNFENCFVRQDGSLVTLSWSGRWDAQEELGYFVARDVTDIKKAEEKLRNSEKRFRTLMENSTNGFSLLAADGTVIEKSSSALKILQRSESEYAGSLRLDLVHPDDLALTTQALAQVQQDPQKIQTIEIRYLMPDSSYIWLEVILHNQLHEPAVGAIILTYRDITSKKSAEIALKTSEARLRQAQAVGQMGSWELDLADGQVLWSDEIYRILGVEKGQLTPSVEVFLSFIHAEDLDFFLLRWETSLANLTSAAISYRIVRPGGEVRFVFGLGHFEFNEQGQAVRFYGTLQDMTERKQTEAALERSEEKYRSLFDLSPIPMWVYDVDTLAFLDVNKAAIREYGYSKEAFLSMTLWDIRPETEYEKLKKSINTIKNNQAYFKDVSRHVKQNGEVIEVEISHEGITLAGKQARLVIANNISERIRYVQAIQEQNARLQEIAWIQSHVVRAPLARMMGVVEVLQKFELSQSKKEELLQPLLDSAHELDAIIRDIVEKTSRVKAESVAGQLA